MDKISNQIPNKNVVLVVQLETKTLLDCVNFILYSCSAGNNNNHIIFDVLAPKLHDLTAATAK